MDVVVLVDRTAWSWLPSHPAQQSDSIGFLSVFVDHDLVWDHDNTQSDTYAACQNSNSRVVEADQLTDVGSVWRQQVLSAAQQSWPMERAMVEKVLRDNERKVRFATKGSLHMSREIV